jgi:hypothetical protein
MSPVRTIPARGHVGKTLIAVRSIAAEVVSDRRAIHAALKRRFDTHQTYP